MILILIFKSLAQADLLQFILINCQGQAFVFFAY